MPYVKLDNEILTSTIWLEDSDTIRIWIYLMATADAIGVVRVTTPIIAMHNQLGIEKLEAILDKLASPDSRSRSPEYEGRRIKIYREPEFEILILNYEKYRTKAYTNAERQRVFRERHRDGRGLEERNVSLRKVTQAEAKAVSSTTKTKDTTLITANAVTEMYPKEFEAFWTAYPRKVGKGKAFQAWKNAKQRPSLSVLVRAIERATTTRDWQKDGGQFIPHPATWLNQRRWEDEIGVMLVTPTQRAEEFIRKLTREARENSDYVTHCFVEIEAGREPKPWNGWKK